MTYYVVTGAAGFIGSRLVAGAQPPRRDRDHRGRQPGAGRQVPQPRRLRDRRLRRQARLPRAPGAASTARSRPSCTRAPAPTPWRRDGRYMMENNYALLARAARLVPGRGGAAPLRLVGLGVRRRAATSARSARARRRSTSTATPSSCSTSSCAERCRRAHRADRRACATSTSTARTRRTRAAWPRSRSTPINQFRADGRVKLFVGSGGYGDGEQRRDFVHVDDVVDVNLLVPRAPRASRASTTAAPARAQSFNEVAAAVINAVQGTQCAAARSSSRKGLIEYIPFPPQLVGQVPELHAGRPVARCARPATSREFMTVEQGVGRATSKELQKT